MRLTARFEGARGASLLVVVGATLALGCANRGSVFEPTPYSAEPLHASAGSIVIMDKRHDVARSRNFDTPLVSSPGTDERAELPLHPDLQQRLQVVINRLLGGAPARLEFHVHVLVAMGGWKSTWTSETELTRVELEVEVYNVGDTTRLAKAFGSAWGEVTSIDAKDDGPAKLLDRAMVAAFEQAIARASSVQTINEALDSRARAASTSP